MRALVYETKGRWFKSSRGYLEVYVSLGPFPKSVITEGQRRRAEKVFSLIPPEDDTHMAHKHSTKTKQAEKKTAAKKSAEKASSNGWADVLGRTDLLYAVLGKRNRVQVLTMPDKRQLRRRGKRGWDILGVIGRDEGGTQEKLVKLVKQATAVTNPHSNGSPVEAAAR